MDNNPPQQNPFSLDLPSSRRRALGLFGAAGLSAVAVACVPASSTCTKVPEETAGPYPGDGSNGPDVLERSGVVRRDIRRSFGSSTTLATGIPLTINMTVLDVRNSCKPLVGAAVYLWHADRLGRYSMYSTGVTGETYLRGVQVTDSAGKISFVTIFPGCYSGRWPHAHFEVYPSRSSITNSANKRATSQLAFPAATAKAVYASSLYPGSAANLSRISLSSDNVFRDGATLQTPTMSGSVSAGYTATITVSA